MICRKQPALETCCRVFFLMHAMSLLFCVAVQHGVCSLLATGQGEILVVAGGCANACIEVQGAPANAAAEAFAASSNCRREAGQMSSGCASVLKTYLSSGTTCTQRTPLTKNRRSQKSMITQISR